MAKKSARIKKAHDAPPAVTSEEALAFIRRLQTKFRRAPRTKAGRARVQEYLARFTDRYLRAVGTRVQGDLMLRPPVTIAPKTVRKPTTPKRKRAN